ncbi:hypothetical protein H5410_060674 [Solanum commersonii]|uniref:Putative plant transposon protein domain-containing protein n=1 Tax=Solanum commersonii TaxID=4109 RepID=A0A9J5W6R6_SOLCO|nr:hypothetical protein H5410_060674 [Solanum commersonii]
MTVRGVNVTITPAILNNIVGSSPDVDPLSMVQWTKHNGKKYHQSLPYAHMLREVRVWLKNVIKCLIPGLHYMDITRDRICLVYALMTAIELNIGAVLKLAMQKTRVYKRRMYAFGCLITRLCRAAL